MTAMVIALWLATAPAPAAAGPCGPRLDQEIVRALRERQFLDAHVLSRTAAALCPETAARHRVQDAIALMALDDPARAREVLHLAGDGPEARVLHAWSFLRERDDEAFRRALPALPAEARLRLSLLEASSHPPRLTALAEGLDPAVRGEVSALAGQIARAENTRRPWLAGTLSVVLPGAGQAYAGSWQGAAVAFVLNATLIAATAELAYRRLYFAAGAAGLAASFFYTGNVINAVDLARRRNEMAAAPARRALERALLPEAHP